MNAKMYLANDMCEFVIEEFARNNVMYHAVKNVLLENGDIVVEITYDQNQHFVGNFIFTAAVAYSNHFLKKSSHQLYGSKIIEEAMKPKNKVKVDEVRKPDGDGYFYVSKGSYNRVYAYKDIATDDLWSRQSNLKMAMELAKKLEQGGEETTHTIYESE